MQFKRGQTFDFSGPIKNNGQTEDLSAWTPSCELKRTDGDLTLIQEMGCEWLDAETGLIRIFATAAQTVLWPLETLQFDIRLEAGEVVVISDTQTIEVVERITND